MKKKILVTLSVIACALLLVVGSVAGTLAYLTATASVENTFTVGNVAITMDESQLMDDSYYKVDPSKKTTAGNEYHLIPGMKYEKDPTIYVGADSEDCWLFVRIENGLKNVLITTDDGDNLTIETQLEKNGWKLISGTVNVYGREAAATQNDTFKVFSTFTLANDADFATKLTVNEGAVTEVIKVTAFAIQADGFANAAAAWEAAPADWK